MRTFVFILILIPTLYSCNNKNEYSIRGSFMGTPTEDWIYLVKFMDSNPTVDSALIFEGTFEFKGTVDFPEVYGLHYHPTKITGICPLFLEPADLEITIDLKAWDVNSTVSGGMINDEFTRLEQPNKKIMELFGEMSNANLERRNEIEGEIGKIRAEYDQQNIDYIRNNPGSPISIYLLSRIFPMFSPEEQGETLDRFTPEIKLTSIYQTLHEEYLERISPEISTPSLVYDTDIEEFNSDLKDKPVIETLLNNNPGKHLLIDVWGTWCGPCFKEFPATRDLVANLKYSDVDIVYLCLDCDEDQWRVMLQKEELIGQHYSVKRKFLARFLEEVGTMGIGAPRYLVIDKTGKIIDNDAPKPSSGKLKEILLNL